MRVILAMVVLALIGRRTGLEKCHQQELFFLGCIHNKEVVNITHFVAIMMRDIIKGVKARGSFGGGHLVTRIGRKLGVDFSTCTPMTDGMRLYGINWLRSSHLVNEFTDLQGNRSYRWVPIRQLEGEEEEGEEEEEAEEEEQHHEEVPAPVDPMHQLVDQMGNLMGRFGTMETGFQGVRSDIQRLDDNMTQLGADMREINTRLDNRFSYEDNLWDGYFSHVGYSYTDAYGTYHPYEEPPQQQPSPMEGVEHSPRWEGPDPAPSPAWEAASSQYPHVQDYTQPENVASTWRHWTGFPPPSP